MISSVRLDGTTACMTIEGASNTKVFQAYVRKVLVPSLRSGDIVVMDNLGAHKNELTLALIEQAGAETRFVPGYSSDLNPIETLARPNPRLAVFYAYLWPGYPDPG
jgi:transposase